jgi:hypothetical protein
VAILSPTNWRVKTAGRKGGTHQGAEPLSVVQSGELALVPNICYAVLYHSVRSRCFGVEGMHLGTGGGMALSISPCVRHGANSRCVKAGLGLATPGLLILISTPGLDRI